MIENGVCLCVVSSIDGCIYHNITKLGILLLSCCVLFLFLFFHTHISLGKSPLSSLNTYRQHTNNVLFGRGFSCKHVKTMLTNSMKYSHTNIPEFSQFVVAVSLFWVLFFECLYFFFFRLFQFPRSHNSSIHLMTLSLNQPFIYAFINFSLCFFVVVVIIY